MITTILRIREDFQVTQEGQPVTHEFTLDAGVTDVQAVGLTSDREDLLFYRGDVKIQINSEEHVAEKTEAKLLMTGLNVDPNDRMLTFPSPVLPGSGNVRIDYNDNAHNQTVFQPYRVSVYFLVTRSA